MTRKTPIGKCDRCNKPILWGERVSASLTGIFHQRCVEGVPADTDPEIVPALDADDVEHS